MTETQDASITGAIARAITKDDRSPVDYRTSYGWVTTIPADFDDIPSFRHMRAKAQGELDEHERIGQTFPEALRKTEWDDVFADDNAKRREAIRLIDERLTALGIDIQQIIATQRSSPLYHNS